jgi:hypothetical protein
VKDAIIFSNLLTPKSCLGCKDSLQPRSLAQAKNGPQTFETFITKFEPSARNVLGGHHAMNMGFFDLVKGSSVSSTAPGPFTCQPPDLCSSLL